MSDFAIPKDDFAEALISFNIGVELGQLAVISIAFVLLRFWFQGHSKYRKFIVVPGSVLSQSSVITGFWNDSN